MDKPTIIDAIASYLQSTINTIISTGLGYIIYSITRRDLRRQKYEEKVDKLDKEQAIIKYEVEHLTEEDKQKKG